MEAKIKIKEWLISKNANALWQATVSKDSPILITCYSVNGNILLLQEWNNNGNEDGNFKVFVDDYLLMPVNDIEPLIKKLNQWYS